jgi:hypothetical protein
MTCKLKKYLYEDIFRGFDFKLRHKENILNFNESENIET